MTVTYYQLLGVDQDATTEEIRSAWRRAMRTVHSDVGGDDRQAQVCNEAYAVLRDPDSRRRYDAGLAGTRPARGSDRGAGADWTAEYEWDGEPEENGYEEPARERERRHEQPRTAERSERSGRSERRKEEPSEWHPPRPPFWLGQLDTSAPLRAHPPPGRRRWVFFAVAGVWIAADLALVVFSLLRGVSGNVLFLVLILLALPVRRTRSWVVWGLNGCAALFALACVVGGIAAVAGGDRLAGVVVVALAVGMGVARVLGQVWLRHRDVDRLVGAETTYEQNLFGVPGRGLFEGMVSKPGGCGAGWTRERRGADLLSPVLAIPGAKLFHAAPLPGERRVWVDHVVVCGDRVALVDNRYWPPGRYDVDEDGTVRRDGAPVTGSVASLDQAVDAWRRYLPRAVVHGFCVVWPTGERAATATGTGPRFTFAATDTAADVIGSWLLPGAGTVHRTVVHAVLTAAP